MISLPIFFLLVTSVLCENAAIPVHYDIVIVPDLNSLTFSTRTTISLSIEESITTITLNSKNLNVSDVRVSDSNAEEVPVNFNLESDTVVISSETELNGLYEIYLTAEGQLNQNYEGFYVTKYKKIVGEIEEERSILLTDFRYDKASQVFPCFDDPAKPSVFTLSIVRPNDYQAVSNMGKISSEDYDVNRTKDIFARTDTIPTYLLSFAIIDFPEKNLENTVIYSRTEEETDYLSKLSVEVSEKFQELYSYTLPKLHQIIVPDSAISNDVLENFGLIIYRESVVLYKDDRENVEDKQAIAKVITHAIVRQWYKDLESFEFGAKSWVVEGRTIWYEFEVLDQICPTWRIYEQFLINDQKEVLDYDIGTNAISLTLLENETPDLFSKYHLTKSFALVRMFSAMPIPDDVLENEYNPDAISWTQNAGYPILTVTRNNNIVTFSQGSENLRSIPINIAFENGSFDPKNFDFVLEETEEQRNYDHTSASWYIVNLERLGYYRVYYDENNWQNLITFLTTFTNDISVITYASKATLIDDAFHFATSGSLNYTVYLELVKYLKREVDYIPIFAFIQTANELRSLLSHTTAQEKFILFARDLIQHTYEIIGINLSQDDSEGHISTLSRIKILTFLCNFGYERCQEEMHDILSTSQSVHPDLQELVYCGGMRLGEIEKFMSIYEQHNIHRKKRLLRSMACTSNSEILHYYITAVVDNNAIVHLNQEDKVDAFLAIVEDNDIGVEVALSFAKQYLEQILASFTYDDISKMFLALSKKLVTNSHEEMVNAMIECLTDEQKNIYGQLFENVKNNILSNKNWQSEHLETINNWLVGNIRTTLPPTETTESTLSTTPPTPTPTTTPIATTPASATTIEISFTVFVYLLMYLIL